ncbi:MULTISPECIES: hypothetical protein [Cupriavidus]|uniref:Uncharacterized protein n=2 Tax=Cupriavidus metallidurans TaxID=119219 RepID=Q58AP2_CUPMC|nr:MULTISPECIES: hypothetical protein [Cupriavidus]HBD34032.1 hypothetical protein [Cupriavidus sp.]ABF12862.1 hypothetical protein Rmet_6003 [Cupriavidus metallidurans CH34]QGS31163.1 hypothetical protein FOB83_19725 [Cupriavidus metallidurans]QWE98191.1 hypothetical protein KLP38_28800 [Cupriavidus sp. EM10]CAI11225.1 hypothetical protein [Cupriavidus metallidurans CH34]
MNEALPTKHELRRQMHEALGSWLYARRATSKTKQERAEHVLDYRRRRNQLAAGMYREEVNARGNTVHRDLDADLALGFVSRDRYVYDSKLCGAGWQQYDTDQDAPYFGCWVNLEKRWTMCYAEGDRILVKCPSEESLKAELADMDRFYGRAPAAFTLFASGGQATQLVCERPSVTP